MPRLTCYTSHVSSEAFDVAVILQASQKDVEEPGEEEEDACDDLRHFLASQLAAKEGMPTNGQYNNAYGSHDAEHGD